MIFPKMALLRFKSKTINKLYKHSNFQKKKMYCNDMWFWASIRGYFGWICAPSECRRIAITDCLRVRKLRRYAEFCTFDDCGTWIYLKFRDSSVFSMWGLVSHTFLVLPSIFRVSFGSILLFRKGSLFLNSLLRRDVRVVIPIVRLGSLFIHRAWPFRVICMWQSSVTIDWPHKTRLMAWH